MFIIPNTLAKKSRNYNDHNFPLNALLNGPRVHYRNHTSQLADAEDIYGEF